MKTVMHPPISCEDLEVVLDNMLGPVRTPKRFACHDQGSYVECSAPISCNSQCALYRAKVITGVDHRPLFAMGKLSGYIDGCRLVAID